MTERDPLFFKYFFIFADGKKLTIQIKLDENTLKFVPKESGPSSWTKLDHHKCSNCPLDSSQNVECPLALNLSAVIPKFSDIHSYDNVLVMVETYDRTFSKNTSMQNALSAMLGILMVTSDCPNMESLKPMVRFHLPFATVEETVFRSVSTYLLGQYFNYKQGKQADWDLKNLKENYKKIQLVNQGMAKRMRSVADKDANVNALVVLDIFAKELPFSIEQSLKELDYLYTSATVKE
jgi:Domain of unknown function (DUF6901)